MKTDVSDKNDTSVHNIVNPVHQFPDVKVFYTSDKIKSSPHFDKPPPHPSTVKSSKLISTSCKGFNDNTNKYDKPPPNYPVKDVNNNKSKDYYGPAGHDGNNKFEREPHHNRWGDRGYSHDRNRGGYRGRGRGGYNRNYGYDRHNWKHNDDRSPPKSGSKNVPISSCVGPEKITEPVKKSAPSLQKVIPSVSTSSKSSSWASNVNKKSSWTPAHTTKTSTWATCSTKPSSMNHGWGSKVTKSVDITKTEDNTTAFVNKIEVSSDKYDDTEHMLPFVDKGSINDDKKSLDKKFRYNRLHEQYQNMSQKDQVLFLGNLVESKIKADSINDDTSKDEIREKATFNCKVIVSNKNEVTNDGKNTVFVPVDDTKKNLKD